MKRSGSQKSQSPSFLCDRRRSAPPPVAERWFHSFQLPCIGNIASRTRRHAQT